jgi:hypothetical protein
MLSKENNTAMIRTIQYLCALIGIKLNKMQSKVNPSNKISDANLTIAIVNYLPPAPFHKSHQLPNSHHLLRLWPIGRNAHSWHDQRAL